MKSILSQLKTQSGLLIALLVMITFFSLKSQYFFTYSTFITVLNQVPHILLLSTAMSLVLIIGGIDLSVGSILGLSGAVFGVLIIKGYALLTALVLCLCTGFASGMLNGLIITYWRIPSFIVTLGMLEAGRGLTYIITNSRTQYIGSVIEPLFNLNVFGLRLPLFIALAIIIITHIFLQYIPIGRQCFAIGANPETARLSGISVSKVTIIIFTLSGLLSALGGVMHCARLNSADPNAGIGYELSAIASAVIGGNSLSGGKGSVIGTFLGVLIISTLEIGLVQISVSEPWKRVITGSVIILAVVLDVYRNKIKILQTLS